MKLGIFYPSPPLPYSFVNYIDNVVKKFDKMGVEYSLFANEEELSTQSFDLLWHPFLSGLWFPEYFWDERTEPLIVTVHGVRPFVYTEPNLSTEMENHLNELKQALVARWHRFEKRVSRLITVSHTAVAQIHEVYQFPLDRIEMIYHGVDHALFTPQNDHARVNEFLSISEYQPVKNIDLIIRAFRQLRTKTGLRLHLPHFDKVIEDRRINLTTDGKTMLELAELYARAKCFVFPTFHESFGLPILEAMASGCPVITSKFTGTEEVAGDAAWLIDPFSVEELYTAMKVMDTDQAVRNEYVRKGLLRAAEFTWSKCAQEHYDVFNAVFALKNS